MVWKFDVVQIGLITHPDLGYQSLSPLIMYSSNHESSSSSVEDDHHHLHLKYMKLVAATTVANIVTTAAITCTEPLYNKIPYHDSALTGTAWVLELLNGHPEHIHNELGVNKNVFNALIKELELAGYVSSKHVYLKEQLAIFLYTCVTGLSLCHVCKHFQHSGETVSKYVSIIQSHLTLININSPDISSFCLSTFHHHHFILTTFTSHMIMILSHLKYFPFFKDCLGAVNGSHINCKPSVTDQQVAHDCKGAVSQNCLAICNFDMKFLYIFSGWDGSASDSTMFCDVCVTDLPVLHGKYYLANAGFPICDMLKTTLLVVVLR